MKVPVSHIATRSSRQFMAPGYSRQTELSLEYPQDSIEPARNNRPVVLLHGTLVKKEGIEAFRDFALRNGHPVSHKTYNNITKGGAIEESTEHASRQVNLSRAEIGRKNLRELVGLDRLALQNAFHLDPNLYESFDPSVEPILDHLPQVLKQVQELLTQSTEEIAGGLSGQIKRLEADFFQQLSESGVAKSKARGIAEEIVDSIIPKAILIGHSAGGFVAYNMVVNPEVDPDKDKFTYDGGNGVAEALILSSPIEKGLSKPAPPGVAELPFYNYEKNVLRPLEALPSTRFALMNPFISAAYSANKSLWKSLSAAGFMVAASMSSPITYAMRPGNEQVEEGSDFFQTHIQDKAIPEGVSVVTFTSPLDRLSEEERSALQTQDPNGQTFSVDIGVHDTDLRRERPTWTHVIMTEKPDQFKEQFGQAILNEPERLSRILDPANDEGVRHEALKILVEPPEPSQALWEQDPSVRQALERVASEKLPFKDSASHLAHQLLSLTS